MAEITARFKPGQGVPCFATTAVSAGRFVAIGGAKTAQGDYPVDHAGAGALVFGVAEYDSAPATQPATDQERRINVNRGSTIARVVAGDAVAVGDFVASDAAGKAVEATTGDYVAGVALTASTLEDDIIEVALMVAPLMAGGDDLLAGLPIVLTNVQADEVLKYNATAGPGGTPAWVNAADETGA